MSYLCASTDRSWVVTVIAETLEQPLRSHTVVGHNLQTCYTKWALLPFRCFVLHVIYV